jgi:bla regulator protein blaR1
MITYCINTILCSGYFIIIYLLLLQGEKMHRFNRFYLLSSIVLSFIIPVVTIQLKSSPVGAAKMVYSTTENVKTAISGNTVLPPNDNLLPQLLILCYSVVSIILLIKFFTNVYSLLWKAWSAETVSFHSAKLVLLEAQEFPYSFLHYIFIDRQRFETGNIQKEILTHELTHVRQKHSVDVVLIELVKVFCWFNPFVIY